MKKKQLISALVVLVLLAVLVIVFRDRIHFDFANFKTQLKRANWSGIALAVGCIYLGYVFRALRWALFLKPMQKVGPFSLLGSQVMGFAAIGILGRPAEFVRPYLVARRTKLTFSSQMAVYVVERMFDLGAMALIFSTVLLTALFFTHETLPHPELLKKVAESGLIGTLVLAIFIVTVRIAGGMVATVLEKGLGVFSQGLGQSASDKVRAFRDGLNTLQSPLDLGLASVLSLGMWMMISLAYLETTRAFSASPELASMTLARCMVLMASSMVASSISLPVISWFTSIGIVAGAMHSFFNVAPEPATACAATLYAVTFLGVIPVGLIWSQFEHVSLRNVTSESEQAGEELAAHHDTVPEPTPETTEVATEEHTGSQPQS